MIESTLPVTRTVFSTRDVDEAREVLGRTYGERLSIRCGEPDRFLLETENVELDDLALDDVHHRSTVESTYSPPGEVLVLAGLRQGRFAVGDHALGAGDVIGFRSDHARHIRSADVSVDVVRLGVSAAERVAGEMSGLPAGSLRLHAGAPVSAARARYWHAVRRWVGDHVLADDDLVAQPLVRAEAFRSLARATLLTLPNTALDLATDPTAPAPGTGEPATVRRAVEYIDANAQHDIDIVDIADAARLGPRGIQAAFRRHRGQTPTEYLRAVRLDGAHRDLLAADPTRGGTVAAVCARWGFTHPGRFSVEYRRRYQCSPSQTLRR